MTDSIQIWNKYEERKDQHRIESLSENVKMCHRFYEGDQWYGVEKTGERLPKYNFIKPSVDYKVSMVAKNNMSIHYSPMADTKNANDIFDIACGKFNEIAVRAWENTNMESKMWEIVKNACITGDSYLYFYDGKFNSQIISKENVFFADEAQKEIQKQEYIIISERKSVGEVKREAEENGISKKDLDLIVPDTDENPEEIEKLNNQKCTSLLYMFRENGEICYLRTVRNLIYSPLKKIHGLKLYPLCSFIWNHKYKSSRGIGEVYEMIPNQISANALLVRREMNNKMTGYAKPVYNSDLIENPESITKVGTAIKISGAGIQNVADAFSYIAPAPMSGTVKQLQDEIINVTRELNGAGDAIVGQINPERASGTAIIAVQEQAAISLNEQSNSYRQFIEDVAKLWFNLWIVYHPEGMKAEYSRNGESFKVNIPSEILSKMEINVRVDVSPVNAFSKFAREQALENALVKNLITFNEYVEALDDDCTAPKRKFADILKKRNQMSEEGINELQ